MQIPGAGIQHCVRKANGVAHQLATDGLHLGTDKDFVESIKSSAQTDF